MCAASKFRRRAAGLAVAAAVAVSGARWAVDLSPLPPPSGTHAVGTRVVEIPALRRGDDATLPAQVWYPAPATDATPAPLFPMPKGFAEAVSRPYPLPAPLVAGPLGWLRGNAVADVPRTVHPTRIVVLVHGWRGFRAIHADLAEQLASEGALVVAADHVGGALAAQPLDGPAIPLDPELLPAEGHPEYWSRAETLVRMFAGDVRDVLDALPELAPGVVVGGVTVIAHSTGGGAALLVADDPRIGGMVLMDPWVEPAPPATPVSIPVIALRSAAWVGNDNDQILGRLEGVELRAVPGTVHTDFTILGAVSPLTRLAGLTAADPAVPRRAVLRADANLQAASSQQ